MMIFETDTEYIAEDGNIRIRVEKINCPRDYVAYLQSELERVKADLAKAQAQEEVNVMRPTEWSKWQLIRQKRNQLLAECDWTQAPDAPLTAEQKQAWRQYRQALRDLPQKYARADDVVWPTPPG